MRMADRWANVIISSSSTQPKKKARRDTSDKPQVMGSMSSKFGPLVGAVVSSSSGAALREASGSSGSMDLPGLRKDAPGRVGRVRARLPDLSSLREWRQEALDELEKDRSADTTRSSDESRWRTILKILSSNICFVSGLGSDPEESEVFFSGYLFECVPQKVRKVRPHGRSHSGENYGGLCEIM